MSTKAKVVPGSTIPQKAGKTHTNVSFGNLVTYVDKAVQGPNYVVPDGCIVYVRASGAAAGTDITSVANSYDQAMLYGGQQLTPNTQVAFPCANTNEIWYRGTADGSYTITITVLG